MFRFNLSRMLAVAERDLRRFMRNSRLFIPMALMPMIYLVILGKSMGGDLHELQMAVVAQDHGPAAVLVQERLQALAQSRRLFRIDPVPDLSTAMAELREGRYKGVVIVPHDFSESYMRGEGAKLGLALDNTDNTSANVIEAEVRRAMAAPSTTDLGGAPPGTGASGGGGLGMGGGSGSLAGSSAAAGGGAPVIGVQVQRVDIYGHKEFMQYLVPGVIALALFFIAMLAGGIILVDDRARGIHEGYFVTPLTAVDLVGGLTLSATTLAMMVGTVVLFSSILIARLPIIGGLRTLLLTETAILLLALDLILFMFTLMARVSNPLTPRSLFGILNVLTFFPSGALYPTESYPVWLSVLSKAFPMRYAVHALRVLLLKGVGFDAVLPDFLFLGGFAAVMLVLAAVLFKRTL